MASLPVLKSIYTHTIGVPAMTFSHSAPFPLPFRYLSVFTFLTPGAAISPFLWRIRNAVPIGLSPFKDDKDHSRNEKTMDAIREELISEKTYLEIQYKLKKGNVEEKAQRSVASIRQTSWEILVRADSWD